MTPAAQSALSADEALALRLRSLLLVPEAPAGSAVAAPGRDRPPSVDDVGGVVLWFGAMQAQDLASGLWSLGVRLPSLTQADVEASLERREALRTWPMRGTVHLVPSRDAHWMLDVLGARPLAGAPARRATIGLDDIDAERSVDVLGAALAGGRRLTRKQCVEALASAGIDSAGQRGYHLLWYASQRGVTCIAPNVDGEQTFVLLDEWVPDPVRLDRDEALATIALRYFRSHGPATRQDFAGWTGLSAADTKRGIQACGSALTVVRVGDLEMLAATQLLDPPDGRSVPDLLALPGFDEYMLGFKDRSLFMQREHLREVVPGSNGVFRATIVGEGRVIATWKRELVGTSRVRVRVWPLRPMGAKRRRDVERRLVPFGTFLGRTVEVQWDAG